MTLIKAAKLAREAMQEWTWLDTPPPNVKDALAALDQAIAKAEQPAQPAIPPGYTIVPVEPTDEMVDAACNASDLFRLDFVRSWDAALNAASPKRKAEGAAWQWLTDEEIEEAARGKSGHDEFARAIEAKLKEKNT
jgi:hypothetical protein